MLLREFWYEYYYPSTANLRESTRIGYKSAWNCHISEEFGNKDLRDINAYNIEIWLSQFPTAGAARKSYGVLRAMIKKAVKWDFIDKDPTTKGIELPKKRNYHPEILSVKEILTLIETFKGHYLEAFVLCSVSLGLRRGEACGLTWEDIDWEEGSIKIERSRQYVNGEIVILDPKTEKSERLLYLPEFALKRLWEIRSEGWITGDISPNKVAKDYKKHCENSGIKYVPCTNLRHSYASASISAGNNIYIVSKTLGHTDISTTAKYYLVPNKDMFKEAQVKWENNLFKDEEWFRLIAVSMRLFFLYKIDSQFDKN